MDVEIKASGLTRQMEKDLLVEMGIDSERADDTDEEEENEKFDDAIVILDTDDDFNKLSLEDGNLSETDLRAMSKDNIKDHCTKKELEIFAERNERIEETLMSSRETHFMLGIESKCEVSEETLGEKMKNCDRKFKGINKIENNRKYLEEMRNVNDDSVESDEIPELVEECEFFDSFPEKELNDKISIRSYSTASTIAPELIKMKTKLALHKREKKNSSRRALVKGEASATTRVRRENRDAIKQSSGIWGWE